MKKGMALATVAMVAAMGCVPRAGMPGRPEARVVPIGTPQPAVTEAPPAVHAASEGGPAPAVLRIIEGPASFYANSLAGHATASGEPYDPTSLVAAHPDLPFGTMLRVTNPANGLSVEVRVIDRGPFTKGRVIDVSRRAAEALDMIRQGVVQVRIEVLGHDG
jgi:rare lipoprotein A